MRSQGVKFIGGLTKNEIIKLVPGLPVGSFNYWRDRVGLAKIGERRIGRGTHLVYPPNAAALIFKAWSNRDQSVGGGYRKTSAKTGH